MICDYTKYNYCIYDYICNICVRVCHAWSVVSLVTESMSIAVMNFAQAWFEKEPRCLCLSDAIRFDPGWDRRCTWWMFHRVSSCVEYLSISVLGSFGINLEVKLNGSLGNQVRSRAWMFLKIPDVQFLLS